MMKRWVCAILAILLVAVSLSAALGETPESDDVAATGQLEPEGDGAEGDAGETGADPAGRPFVGSWACGRATIDISAGDGDYQVFISWANSAAEVTEWNYSCKVEKGRLVSVSGEMSTLVYGEDGEIVSDETEYADGVATFEINGEDRLIWNDEKENAGEDMEFERLEFYAFAPTAKTLAEELFEPLIGLPWGTAGASLAQAGAACDVLAFAADYELGDISDPENLDANLLACWEELSDEDRAAFSGAFEGIASLLDGSFEDWKANRGAFDDVGMAEKMEALLADEATRDAWEALRDAVQDMIGA